MGDQMSLIHSIGARASDVQFLKSHHIRLGAGDHAGDAFGIQLAIHASAAVYVIVITRSVSVCAATGRLRAENGL